jgi:hypothetical protein
LTHGDAWLVCPTVRVTESGAFVQTDRPGRVGDLVHIRLSFPGANSPALDLRAHITALHPPPEVGTPVGWTLFFVFDNRSERFRLRALLLAADRQAFLDTARARVRRALDAAGDEGDAEVAAFELRALYHAFAERNFTDLAETARTAERAARSWLARDDQTGCTTCLRGLYWLARILDRVSGADAIRLHRQHTPPVDWPSSPVEPVHPRRV